MDIPIGEFFEGIIGGLQDLVTCPGVFVLLVIVAITGTRKR